MKPAREKCPGTGFSSNIDHWNGFGPTSEPADKSEKAVVTTRLRKRTHNIDVDQSKRHFGSVNWWKWNNGVMVNFG